MDPISHALLGHAIAQTTPAPRPRGVVAALILGALAPDGDLVLVTQGFDVYLRAHAQGTHSLIGSPVDALIVATFLRLIVRHSQWRTLFLAAWAGVLSHIVSDLASGSDMAILWPFSPRFFGFHLFTMVEPLVLATLIVGVIVWWRWRTQARAIAGSVLAILISFTGLKYASKLRAEAVYARAVRLEAPVVHRIRAMRGHILEWWVHDRTANRVRAWDVEAFGDAAIVFERKDAEPSPAVDASRDLPSVRRFLTLDGVPFVRTERDDDRTVVLWSDVRHCSADACDVSFGGTFDSSGRAINEIFQIGTLRKIRGPLPLTSQRASPIRSQRQRRRRSLPLQS